MTSMACDREGANAVNANNAHVDRRDGSRFAALERRRELEAMVWPLYERCSSWLIRKFVIFTRKKGGEFGGSRDRSAGKYQSNVVLGCQLRVIAVVLGREW